VPEQIMLTKPLLLMLCAITPGGLTLAEPAAASDTYSVAESAQSRLREDQVATAPPKIVVAYEPTVLVVIDGPPTFSKIDDSRFQRVLNTPFMLAREGEHGVFWLHYGERWYTAANLSAQWRLVDEVSHDIDRLGVELAGSRNEKSTGTHDVPRNVVVSFEPAELISSDGPPRFEPIPGTNILGLVNGDGHLFARGDDTFVLLAGRWYANRSFPRGEWRYVAPNDLPGDFARIPPDSKYAAVRAHVPGTPEAKAALADARTPRTARVARDASIDVTYERLPEWQPIAGTSLSYATNTPYEVIRYAPSQYYCCHSGCWYSSSSPYGIWTVARRIPHEFQLIPPSCPLYHVRFVMVFNSTPDHVFVGYYPGYLGSYVCNGTVVWGTGYHHYRPFYYSGCARPLTWGLGMVYDPWRCHWDSSLPHGHHVVDKSRVLNHDDTIYRARDQRIANQPMDAADKPRVLMSSPQIRRAARSASESEGNQAVKPPTADIRAVPPRVSHAAKPEHKPMLPVAEQRASPLNKPAEHAQVTQKPTRPRIVDKSSAPAPRLDQRPANKSSPMQPSAPAMQRARPQPRIVAPPPHTRQTPAGNAGSRGRIVVPQHQGRTAEAPMRSQR
jgi:hypothetical protein